MLLLHHILDTIHTEKNECESNLGTLLDINGKTRDGLNAHKDLQEMGTRKGLHLDDRGGRTYIPHFQNA